MVTTGQPLSGRCILLTRARLQAAPMVKRIEQLGGTAWTFPVIAIEDPDSWAPVDRAIAQFERYRWLVFTSTNGVDKFLDRMQALGVAQVADPFFRVVAVGATTAKRLVERGLPPHHIPTDYRASAMPALIQPLAVRGEQVLMPRGNLADPLLADELRKLGLIVDDVVVYRTTDGGGDAEELKQALQSGRIHYVTFTSGSTVAQLIERLGSPELLAQTRIACIGPETRKVAEAAGLRVSVTAAVSTVQGLVDAIAEDSRDER